MTNRTYREVHVSSHSQLLERQTFFGRLKVTRVMLGTFFKPRPSNAFLALRSDRD